MRVVLQGSKAMCNSVINPQTLNVRRTVGKRGQAKMRLPPDRPMILKFLTEIFKFLSNL
jgi:hypothetical protein